MKNECLQYGSVLAFIFLPSIFMPLLKDLRDDIFMAEIWLAEI